MDRDNARASVIGPAGKIIRDLVSQPFHPSEETEDDEGGTIYAQSLPTEMAIEKVALLVSSRSLFAGWNTLSERTHHL